MFTSLQWRTSYCRWDMSLRMLNHKSKKDGTVDHTRCTFLFEDKDGIEYAIKALTKK